MHASRIAIKGRHVTLEKGRMEEGKKRRQLPLAIQQRTHTGRRVYYPSGGLNLSKFPVYKTVDTHL
jgi:hypothetical protein